MGDQDLGFFSPALSVPGTPLAFWSPRTVSRQHPSPDLEALIFEHSEHAEPLPQPAVSKREMVRVIAERIKRYNSDIDPRGETFRAAVLLLAASEFGQNIDVLARCTGFERSFVARCARRLIDNGVWVGGSTVADWSSADEASGTFWNDVAVAEGKMCRRVTDGSVEWAPAGFWNKSFHFNDPEADKRTDNLYLDSLPSETVRTPDTTAAPELIGEVHADEGESDPAVDHPMIEQRDTQPAGEPAETGKPADENAVPPLNDVFQDVIWIG